MAGASRASLRSTHLGSPALAVGVALISLALLAGGCSGTPEFTPVSRDAGLECVSSSMDAGTAVPCPTGQVCLLGRCYAECTSTSDCARFESCESGACVPSTTVPDGGGRDAGPPDLCRTVQCDGGVCNPRSGTCVECTEGVHCVGGTSTICDRGRGRCVTFGPSPCSPCSVRGDCDNSAMGGFVGDCVELDGAGEFEQVCAQTCGGDAGVVCQAGLECRNGHCLPRIGTCTTWRAAFTGRMCQADGECAPLGATGSDTLFTGLCGGAPTGVCRHPCGVAADCPANAPACSGMGNDTFCQ